MVLALAGMPSPAGSALNDAAKGHNQNVGQVFNLSGQDAILSHEMRARRQKSELTHLTYATWNDGAGTFYIDNLNTGII